MDIDFKKIVPRCGGLREAFEELCCQLARRTVPANQSFVRLEGAGGDGGVECYFDRSDGSRVGWQAKYVFDVESLLRQASVSLETALSVHSNMTKYVLCFPFDLTGPTRRRGKSGVQKLEEWKNKHIAAVKNRELHIELWGASKLREFVIVHDESGGIRHFFFDQSVLTPDWINEHLESIKATAGPRYTPELNVKTVLWECFAAFGRTNEWFGDLQERLNLCRRSLKQLGSVLHSPSSDPATPKWPEELREDLNTLIDKTNGFCNKCESLAEEEDSAAYELTVEMLEDILGEFSTLESKLVLDLEGVHGEGRADSPSFRQYMAEYMASFPTANLDDTRSVIQALRELHEWLRSPSGTLAHQRVFLLSGVAGSGKTHGVCDAAVARFREGFLTCVAFGHDFGGEPDPWTRLLESLGLPITLGREGLLDLLNAAGESTGSPFVLCIDAINETKPLSYWRDRIPNFVHLIQRRPYLRLCITCRTSFVPYCIPKDLSLTTIEHSGFAGIEHQACQTYFAFYGLNPPIAPILQPELSNPLYLRLVCDTLRSRGLSRIPAGWQGLASTINAFLDEKERQFAEDKETSIGSKTVRGCLMAISRAIAESGASGLPWSVAEMVVVNYRPHTVNLQILEWLIRNDLLLEDVSSGSDNGIESEGTVRPAFERLGDFLIAKEILDRCESIGIETACGDDGPLGLLIKDTDVLHKNEGILSALSILIPEVYPGIEFPDLVDDEDIGRSLMRITVESFSSRDPRTFTIASKSLIQKALARKELSHNAMDALLATSWQKSTIDAFWLDELLKQKHLAVRDSYWCGYLHSRYENRGTVHRLIKAAFELSLDQLEAEVAERWATVLLWFTAAADRRVRDGATRAGTAIVNKRPEIIPYLLDRLITSDDDEIRERTLLSCYGALINTRDTTQSRNAVDTLKRLFSNNPESFDNAIIRDHIRCISELQQYLESGLNNSDPELTTLQISSDWPPDIPLDDKVEPWEKLLYFSLDGFRSDFFIYSMNCLSPWQHVMPKADMGKWMLNRIVNDFGYENSNCCKYDEYMLGKFGGGRGKPVWAERIGKKYQWIAMYQLASRLHDHVERKENDWDPTPLRPPLILLEERQLDPTLPHGVSETTYRSTNWWMKSVVDLEAGDRLSDEEWVASSEGIRASEEFLSEINHDGQRWRLLTSFASWDNRNEEAEWNEPHRYMWIGINSYLVLKPDFISTCEHLRGRNYFEDWMPRGADWSYGFAGEYPWATPFNTEPEEWHGRNTSQSELLSTIEPSWNKLSLEWEYDASTPSVSMFVPARVFFSSNDLFWNSKDGYCRVGGRTVFRDPSVRELGPSSLLVDIDELQRELDKTELRLFWTVLGQKTLSGGGTSPTVGNPFSQLVCLNEDGTLVFEELKFFEDRVTDTGPAENV